MFGISSTAPSKQMQVRQLLLYGDDISTEFNLKDQKQKTTILYKTIVGTKQKILRSELIDEGPSKLLQFYVLTT